MPTLQPAEVTSGRAIQMIRAYAPPSAPYVLQATFAVPLGTLGDNRFAIRRLESAANTAWYQSQVEHIGRTLSHDYYEIIANITDGPGHTVEGEERFAIDLVSGDVSLTTVQATAGGGSVTRPVEASINNIAWGAVNSGAFFGGGPRFSLQFQTRQGTIEQSRNSYLTGFGTPWTSSGIGLDVPQRDRQWTVPSQNIGNHRWGPVARTLYKHIPMFPGGDLGYIHVWATVFANSPEIHFIVNWHNGTVEERTAQPGSGSAYEYEDPILGEIGTPPGGFGIARMRDVLFTRLQIQGIRDFFMPDSPTVPVTGATYTEATKRITKSGAFTNYTHRPNDRFVVDAGTGATAGEYVIASKVDNNTIALETSIGAAADAQTDIGGHVVDYWMITPELRDSTAFNAPADPAMRATSAARPDSYALVKQISDTDMNRLHPLLVTNERSFRFSLHTNTVTPYQKWVVGRADWSKGGWGFSPMGAPDVDAVNSAVVLTFSGATYTDATKAITKTGAFTKYRHLTGDRVYINAGADATKGEYVIASRQSDDEIRLSTSIGAAANGDTDIGGHIMLDLTPNAETAKTRLRTLLPYSWDSNSREGLMTDGMNVLGTFMPGSGQAYGGVASGAGMWYDYGVKSALDPKPGALEILKVEQLRNQSRNPGCLYYNITGMPVNPWRHAANGTNAPWYRRNRTFQIAGGQLRDTPFSIAALREGSPAGMARAQRLLTADYNPGPSGQIPSTNVNSTPTDAIGDGSAPDWWAWGADTNGDGVGDGIPGNLLVANFTISPGGDPMQYDTLRHTTNPPLADLGPFRDEAAPLQVQIKNASTFQSDTTIVFEITGTGQQDLAATEQLTCTGYQANGSYQSVQSFQTAGQFKTVSRIKVISVTGTVEATEMFTFGRASQRIPYYNGPDNITPIDWQHYIRQSSGNKALYLLTNDPLAKLYLWMNAMDARMCYWEGAGQWSNLAGIQYGAPNRGTNSTREHAWMIDAFCTWMAIASAHYKLTDASTGANALVFGETPLSFGAARWLGTAMYRFQNSKMVNGMWISYWDNKNAKESPLGDKNGIPGNSSCYYISAGRENCYLMPTLHMLSNVWFPNTGAGTLYDAYRTQGAALRTLLRGMAPGFKDYATVQLPSPTGEYFMYPPVAARLRNGQYVPPSSIADSEGTWEIFGPTHATIHEANWKTGLAISPATYPTVAADRFVTAVAGNTIGSNHVFTVVNANVGQTYASGPWAGTQIPTPVVLTVTPSSDTFTNAKKRKFRITGTGWNDTTQSVGTITEDLFVQGRGSGAGVAQKFSTLKHFTTVTAIARVDDGDWDSGTLVAGESFTWGNKLVGMRSDYAAEQLGDSEGFHFGYPLAVIKYLCEIDGVSSSDVDTLIQRFTGTASLADALTAMQGYPEYPEASGLSGPGQRFEQHAKLLWQLGQNTGSIAPVADFGKTAASGAAPLTVGVWAKPIGRIATYEWDFAYNGVTPNYTDTGKYATHTYAAPATYTILLRVTDTDGTTATSSQTVVVS